MSAPDRYPLPVWDDAWRSVDERRQGFQPTGELPQDAAELDAPARRDFLKLLGASLSLAGAACTRPQSELLLPYHQTPEGLTQGNPLHYATAATVAGIGVPLLATAREGRPVKLDGNPDHRMSRGASGAHTQAELWRLYDPQRATRVKEGGRPVAKKAFFDSMVRLVTELSRRDGGRGVRFLGEPTSSPLLIDLKARILERLPNARFVSWTPLSAQGRYDGARLAFGRPFEPLYDFSRARVVVALDDDFLAADGPDLGACRDWAARRTPGADLSRLYVVEPSLSVTGTVADHRLAVKGSGVEAIARALVAEVAKARPLLTPAVARPGARATPELQRWVAAVAKDLVQAGPTALVTVGDRQPPVVHALAHALNAELGALGTTVTLVPPTVDVKSGPAGLKALADELALGQVDALVMTAPNPAYAAPANLDLRTLLKRASDTAARGASQGRADKAVVYWGLYEDETALASQWFVPAQHLLEAWGDARALDGSTLFQQPLIEPLYPETFSEVQLYAAFCAEGERAPLEVLVESWSRRQGVPPDDATAALAFKATWEKWLQAGTQPASAASAETAVVDLNAIARTPSQEPLPGLELQLQRDYRVFDGRYAGCAWLQELPDPITKLVWDNAALLSPATARKLGLPLGAVGRSTWAHEAPTVRLTVSNGGFQASLVAPVFVLPGHADDAITLPLGYGRDGLDEALAHGAGVNAYLLRHSDAPWFTAVAAAPAEQTYRLVTTQEHWSMDGRELALQTRAGELEQVQQRLAHLNGTPPTLQQPIDYSKAEYRWGMAIDLSRCTGCSACVIACQAENNVPVVGKEQVARGREMHWLRIDRYFLGELDAPASVVTQPILCQHCETAPCEYVCPVNATVHSDEGLNDMVYNRCIGTRYCSNNCPYKVRRFNYFHWNKDVTPVERLRMNPDVTVRARGVMEKCTFCVQRIERARIAHRREGQKIADGAIQTACQQACPTRAIVFGSLNDAGSEVSQWHQSPRRYELLHELGTRPRNAFLVRVKNPNPELA